MLATSGLALSRMTCLIAGHSIIGIGTLADCCPEEPSGDGPELQAICCAHAEAGGVRAVTIAPGALSLDPVLQLLDGAPSLLVPAMVEVHGPFEWDGRPPPPAVPDRLALTGVYRL